jgi:hypothetical protein
MSKNREVKLRVVDIAEDYPNGFTKDDLKNLAIAASKTDHAPSWVVPAIENLNVFLGDGSEIMLVKGSINEESVGKLVGDILDAVARNEGKGANWDEFLATF